MGTSQPGRLSRASGVAVQHRPLGTEVQDTEPQPKEQAEFQQTIRPREQRIFFGVLDHNHLSFAERMMVKAIRAPEGDFRNWQVIEAWAASIAHALG